MATITPIERLKSCLFTSDNGVEKMRTPIQVILEAQKNNDGTFKEKFIEALECGAKKYFKVLNEYFSNSSESKSDDNLKMIDEFKFEKEITSEGLFAILKEKYCKISRTNQIDIENPEELLIANLLLQQAEEKYYIDPIADMILTIFNSFCLSILKGEYLYDDNFSEDKLKCFLKNSNDILRGDDKIVKAIEDYSISCYLRFLSNLCVSYYTFNRRTDCVISSNQKAFRVLFSTEEVEKSSFNDALKYAQEYKDNFAVMFESLSALLTYLFRNVTEMTYIDHNYVIVENKLDTLLTLKVVIEKIKKLFIDVPSFRSIINEETTKRFFNVLNLIEYKNNLLLYKIKKGDNDLLLERYLYVVGDDISEYDGDSNKKRDKDLVDENSLGVKGKNELLDEIDLFREVVDHKSFDNNESLFLFHDYEKCFFHIIDNPRKNKADINLFKELEDICMIRRREIPARAEHKDILFYNNKITSQITHQFIEYGKWIYNFEIAIASNNFEEYIKKLKSFLDSRNDDTVIYSCTFIIKILHYILCEFKKKSEKESIQNTDDLKYICDRLLYQFSKLITQLESGAYCVNFKPLYQDSFYSFRLDATGKFVSIKRVVISNVDITWEKIYPENEDNEEEVIFIASSWIKPIGIKGLKEKYRKFRELRSSLDSKIAKIAFNNETRKQQELFGEKQKKAEEKIMSKFEKESGRTVQTLGIFAAFLALATISLGALKVADDIFDYILIILSITLCLGLFVVMLDFVFTDKSKEEYINKETEVSKGSIKQYCKLELGLVKRFILFILLFFLSVSITVSLFFFRKENVNNQKQESSQKSDPNTSNAKATINYFDSSRNNE